MSEPNFAKYMYNLLENYKKVVIASADDVDKKQLQNIRKGLRGHSVLLMGENTLMQECIKVHAEKTGYEAILRLLPLIVGNVGLIFTKADFKEVIKEVAKHRVGTPARGLVIKYLYDGGLVFSPEVFDLTEDDLIKNFLGSVFSLSLTSPSQANLQPNFSAISASEVYRNAYKKALALAVAINYPLKDRSKFAVASTSAAAATPTAAASTPTAAAAPAIAVDEKKKAPAEETDDDMGFNLSD